MNLLCGCMGIIFVFNGQPEISAIFIFVAAIFDFLDGLAARSLKAHSPIGKDLDSLADMVSFGVLPGMILFNLSRSFSAGSILFGFSNFFTGHAGKEVNAYPIAFSFAALLIPVFSAIRLAKFNNDTRQTTSFIGLPTPANSLFIASLPLIFFYNSEADFFETLFMKLLENPYLFVLLCATLSYLMIAEIPMFSLKFKNLKWEENKFQFILILIAVILIPVLRFAAIPVLIILYLLLSIINTITIKK